MLPKKITVIKKNRIRMGSPVPLGPTGIISAAGPPGDAAVDSPTAVAQARIVESNSDYVILEMICGCGHKSFVQCNYGNVAGSSRKQETQS